MRVAFLAITYVVALCAAPSVARADSKNAQAKEACFAAAEAAQQLRADKKLSAARGEVLTCSRDVCPAMVRADCAKWLGEIDAATPTIIIRARDPGGRDVVDVKVSVDGQPLLDKLQGTSLPVDPGPHKFRYELPDGKTLEESVLIMEGEKGRVLQVDVKPAAEARVVPAPSGDGSPTRHQGPGVVPWVIGGVGLASLVGFGLLEIPIQTQVADLQNTCARTQSCTQAQLDAVSSLYLPAAILLAVGGTGVVVGATWLIVAAAGGGKESRATALTFAPVPGGGMVGYSGRF